MSWISRLSRTTLTPLAFLAVASNAPSQIVFIDDFEAGFSGWTMNGLWNSESITDTCGGFAAPPSETRYFQFWYRDPVTGGAGFNLSRPLQVQFCP